MLLPHIEIMKQELSLAEELMKRDENPSIEETLVELATTLEIQIQTLEVARSNWDSALSMIQQVHKSFSNKQSLSVTPQMTQRKKGGYIQIKEIYTQGELNKMEDMYTNEVSTQGE